MSAMTLSAKRQVVLPADLCRQMALQPGSRVEVTLAEDGSAILIRPQAPAQRKPASVLFGRVVRHGPAVPIDELQGLAAARRVLGGRPDRGSGKPQDDES
jgi:AbrB family looped-hinge helix DNA binding protein